MGRKSYPVYVGEKCIMIQEKPEKMTHFETNLFPFFPTSAELDKIISKAGKPNSRMAEFSKHYRFLLKSLKEIYRVQFAAGGLVVNNRDQVLFIRRNGHWDLPKGGIESNETKKQAAIRETEEETGLQGVRICGKLPATYHCFWRGENFILKKTRWYEMVYEGDKEPIPQVSEGITEVKWFDKKEIGDLLPQIYPAIHHVLEVVVPLTTNPSGDSASPVESTDQ